MTTRSFVALIAVLIAFFCVNIRAAHALLFPAVRVVRVSDGDSFTAITPDQQRIRVRIAAIDAPESDQAYGAQATAHLARMLQDAEPELDCPRRDRYRRLVCAVRVEGRDIGLAQVGAGAAWWYREYRHEQTPQAQRQYAAAQAEAQSRRLGLWAQPALEPGQWRARQREGR
jgi:micrococcal nuclease